jgi:cellular nucleic acid-binding protein
MQTNIYILKLENNKYYVGKSNDLETRLTSHKNGLASAWTKKYKPISVEKVIPNASSYDENKETIEYMGKYGIDNVRGGIYVTEALDNTQRSEINKQIWGANDCCTQCGRKEHFIKNCKETKDVTGQDIIKTGQDIIKTEQDIIKTGHDIIKTGHDIFKTVQDIFKTSQDILKEEYKDKKLIKTCFDCGKIGHYADKCPNKKETFNCRYCDKEFETQKGAIFHENVHCKSVPKKKETFNCRYCDKEFETQKGAIFHENVYCKSVPKKNECYRCGRSGHYSNNCYAKSDIDGYQLD